MEEHEEAHQPLQRGASRLVEQLERALLREERGGRQRVEADVAPAAFQGGERRSDQLSTGGAAWGLTQTG